MVAADESSSSSFFTFGADLLAFLFLCILDENDPSSFSFLNTTSSSFETDSVASWSPSLDDKSSDSLSFAMADLSLSGSSLEIDLDLFLETASFSTVSEAGFTSSSTTTVLRFDTRFGSDSSETLSSLIE